MINIRASKIIEQLISKEGEKQFMEIFSNYIDKEARSFSKHSLKGGFKDFILCSPMIYLKPGIRYLQANETTPVVIDDDSCFTDLLDIAFDFYQIDCAMGKANITRNEMLQEISLTDENMSILPLKDPIL